MGQLPSLASLAPCRSFEACGYLVKGIIEADWGVWRPGLVFVPLL
jgi:hypothetical protein